jgi:hypothetical protein
MKLLPKDSDWVYDFTTNPLYTWTPGSVVNGNAATFPAATGMGMTVALLNLGPCSILPPHLHPRAVNFVTSINGTTDTYMIAENGARTVHTTLTPLKMTIFPAGSVHTMANRGKFENPLPRLRHLFLLHISTSILPLMPIQDELTFK